MTREQKENFAQDRLGNVNRELDDVRALSGMVEGDGLATIAAADVGSNVILKEIPDDAAGFIPIEIHAYNSTGSVGTFRLLSATLDDTGSIDTVTERSVRFNVSGGVARTISYSGRDFDADAIAVVSQFEGDVGVAGYIDRPEELEPATEQTSGPG